MHISGSLLEMDTVGEKPTRDVFARLEGTTVIYRIGTHEVMDWISENVIEKHFLLCLIVLDMLLIVGLNAICCLRR